MKTSEIVVEDIVNLSEENESTRKILDCLDRLDNLSDELCALGIRLTCALKDLRTV